MEFYRLHPTSETAVIGNACKAFGAASWTWKAFSPYGPILGWFSVPGLLSKEADFEVHPRAHYQSRGSGHKNCRPGQQERTCPVRDQWSGENFRLLTRCVIRLTPPLALWGRYYAHFTDEKNCSEDSRRCLGSHRGRLCLQSHIVLEPRIWNNNLEDCLVLFSN